MNLRAKKVEETRLVKELSGSITSCESQCGDKKKELAIEEEKLVECKKAVMDLNTTRSQNVKDKRKLETDRDAKQSTFDDSKKTVDTISHDLGLINKEKAKLFQ